MYIDKHDTWKWFLGNLQQAVIGGEISLLPSHSKGYSTCISYLYENLLEPNFLKILDICYLMPELIHV